MCFFACALPGAAAAESETARILRQVIFASAEFTGGSVHLGSGFKRAFTKSIDDQGFILMSLSGAGATSQLHRGPANLTVRVARLSNATSVMLGYQWVGERGVLMLAAGPEIGRRQVLDAAGVPRWQSPQRGARVIAEYWHNAGANLMTTGTLVASSAQRSLWGRLAAGYALREGMFLGPEIAGYGEPGYREGRLGMHLTGIPLGPFRFRVNAGFSAIPAGRDGFYVGLAGHFKR